MKDKLLAHSKKLLTLLSETAQSLRVPTYVLRVMMTVTLLLGEHGREREGESTEKELALLTWHLMVIEYRSKKKTERGNEQPRHVSVQCVCSMCTLCASNSSFQQVSMDFTPTVVQRVCSAC